MDVFPLLEKMEELNASDLYLTVGIPPSWRANEMVVAETPPLTQQDIAAMLDQIVSPAEAERFQRIKEVNIPVTDRKGNRYRANCFFQQQKVGIVFRKMRVDLPKIEELQLDNEAFQNAIMEQRGLILVVGPSGSGKSTTIAAMLNHLNQHGSGHVVTIEDPIEYIHPHKKCIFTQREVGVDTLSWSDALKSALRQRPDVIYIGEIRDREAMENALNFAETGHLCIATLHATSASQAVERVANMFPSASKSQYLYSLSQVLKYIFAQRLVSGKNGNKLPIIEVLKNAGNIKNLIVEGKISELKDLMGKNTDYGMSTFEKSLLHKLKSGQIEEDVAISEAEHPDNMRLEIMQSQVTRTAYTHVKNPNIF